MNTAPLTTIRPELLTLTTQQFQALMPYFVVFGGACLAILASVARFFNPKWPVFFLTLATAVWAAVLAEGQMHQEATLIFNSMMISDVYSNFFNLIFMGSVVLTTLASFRYLDHEKL